MVIPYRRSGTTCRPHLQGSIIQASEAWYDAQWTSVWRLHYPSWILDFWKLSRSLGKELPLLAALKPREAQLSSISRRKCEIMLEHGRKPARRSLRWTECNCQLRTNRLMQLTEIIGLWSESPTEHINALCAQNAEFYECYGSWYTLLLLCFKTSIVYKLFCAENDFYLLHSTVAYTSRSIKDRQLYWHLAWGQRQCLLISRISDSSWRTIPSFYCKLLASKMNYIIKW